MGGRSGRTRQIQMHDKETQVSKDLTRRASKEKMKYNYYELKGNYFEEKMKVEYL